MYDVRVHCANYLKPRYFLELKMYAYPFNFRTFTFGTGAPIEPGWSPKFVIAASVTLLVVVLACAGGAAACCYRKYTRSRDAVQFDRLQRP